MRLIFTSAPSEGRVFDLTAARLTIGRIAGNDLQLEDQKVSRHHAVIEVHDGQTVLRDLGSTNGTEINGKRVNRHRLAPGDRLAVGETTLEFRRP